MGRTWRNGSENSRWLHQGIFEWFLQQHHKHGGRGNAEALKIQRSLFCRSFTAHVSESLSFLFKHLGGTAYKAVACFTEGSPNWVNQHKFNHLFLLGIANEYLRSSNDQPMVFYGGNYESIFRNVRQYVCQHFSAPHRFLNGFPPISMRWIRIWNPFSKIRSR